MPKREWSNCPGRKRYQPRAAAVLEPSPQNRTGFFCARSYSQGSCVKKSERQLPTLHESTLCEAVLSEVRCANAAGVTSSALSNSEEYVRMGYEVPGETLLVFWGETLAETFAALGMVHEHCVLRRGMC